MQQPPELAAAATPATSPSSRFGSGWVAAVSVLGTMLLANLAFRLDVSPIARAPVEFALLAGLALLGALFPITLPRERGVERIGTSTTFGSAILFAFGTPAAVLVFALSTVVADLWSGKRPLDLAYDVARDAFSVAAAGATFLALGGSADVSMRSIAPVIAAGLAMFVVKELLAAAAHAISRGGTIVGYLLSDLRFQAATAAALFAMAPIVLVVADVSPYLVPLLAIPVAAAYWGATQSLENVRLVSRLEEALEHEKELSRLKDDFVAVVSHELRTPLTSIQGYLKTLLQLGDGLGDEQRTSFLEAADRQSDRLRRLIEQLLAVARLEAHVEPVAISEIRIASLVEQVLVDLRSSGHDHTFDVRIPDGLPVVRTDEAKVHQIVSNLVENALKYSPARTRVTVRAAGDADGVVISVEDEGGGIPAEAHDRIFERFYQVDSSATRTVGGTGLGLYICRKTSEAIDGRLWLERSTSEGTVFSLWLPLGPPQDPEVDPAAARGVGVAAARVLPRPTAAS